MILIRSNRPRNVQGTSGGAFTIYLQLLLLKVSKRRKAQHFASRLTAEYCFGTGEGLIARSFTARYLKSFARSTMDI